MIENRQELFEEEMNSSNPVKEYIVAFSKDIVSEKDTSEAIAAVMGYAPMPQRVDHVNRALIKLTQIPSH